MPLIAVLTGALVAFTTDASPTGGHTVDAFLRAALGCVTVVAASRSRRWSLVIGSALVTLGSDGWHLLPAVFALGGSSVLALRNRRDRTAGAVVGALIGWSALTLAWPASPQGVTAVLAASALLPLWYSGYTVARRSTRRAIRLALWVIAAAFLLSSVLAAVVLFSQGQRLRDTADATMGAALEVVDGRSNRGAAAIREGESDFRQIADRLASWWMSPPRHLPLLGPNVRALGAAADAGASLSTAAADLAESADLDDLQLDGGRIDIALLRSLTPPAESAAARARAAETALLAAQSTWLAPPLLDGIDELLVEVQQAARGAELIAAGATEVPAILGADGSRRYLLLLGNPAEARDIGGHLGNWAELTARDGALDVVEVGEAYELFTPGSPDRPELTSTEQLPPATLEMDPTRFPQNWGAAADLGTVATLAADLYPQTRPGAPLDGVVYADPEVFAALLGLTGAVEHRGRTIDADNAVQYLTRDQYEGGEEPLGDMVRETLDRFTSDRLPSPAVLANAFGDLVREGRLQFVLLEDGRRRPSELLGLTNLDVPLLDAEDAADDVLLVLNRNANPSKIDRYLDRSIDYVIERDENSGDTTSSIVVKLENRATAEGPDVVVGCGRDCPRDRGTNRTELSVLSRSALSEVTIDGEPVPGRTRSESDQILRHSLQLDIEPGGSRTVVFHLSGTTLPGPSYRLDWFRQPLANDDELRLVFNGRALELGSDRRSRILLGASDD